MARASVTRASGGSKGSRSVSVGSKADPRVTSNTMLMNHGVVGTGIKGGASTARPYPTKMVGSKTPNAAGRLGGTLRRGRRGS